MPIGMLRLKYKHKLVIMTFLEGQLIRTSVLRDCKVLIEGVVLKENLIPLRMWDFELILSTEWLSNHWASVDCFTKKNVFRKLRFLELMFKGDRRI